MILTALLATQFGYAIALDQTRLFSVNVAFEGYLPLLGGKNGKAEVELTVSAKAIPAAKIPDHNGPLNAVESEIQELAVKLNDSELPLTKQNLQTFFPKAVATFTPAGIVMNNTAPRVKLPVRLPGLDSQRFPDISYLPLNFSPKPISVGDSYSFDKVFGGSPVTYTVTLKEFKDGIANFTIKLKQDATDFEDEFRNPVDEEKEARFKLETKLEGTGNATFDTKVSLFKTVQVDATANTVVTNLKSKVRSDRKLRTVLNINLKPQAKS